jgi:hypothetical protein
MIDFAAADDLGIDLCDATLCRDCLGCSIGRIAFGIQRLPLQVGSFNNVAIHNRESSDARARKNVDDRAPERAAANN